MSASLTSNQRAILQTLANFRKEGHVLDLDQLIRMVPYDVTKQAIQFTIRSLTRRGLVVRGPDRLRKGRFRRTLLITPEGLSFIRE